VGFFAFCTSECICPWSFGDFLYAAKVYFLFGENSDASL